MYLIFFFLATTVFVKFEKIKRGEGNSEILVQNSKEKKLLLSSVISQEIWKLGTPNLL